MKKRILVVSILILALVMVYAPRTRAQETKIVSFLTTFGGTELDAMNVSLSEFTKQTGILVTVESNRQSMDILRTRIAGGNPPDLALIPQPGTLAEFAKAGNLKALVNKDGSKGLIDKSVLTDNYAQGIIDLGTVDGTVYGILAKANSKSTVWYKPASFKALGVEVPKTWDELLAIQKKYVDAGKTPWSIGGSDNWTLTDWFENIYVRLNGPDKYRQLFVTHEIPWTDESVVNTLKAWQMVVDPADKNLAGGADGTLSTGFQDAANLVFRADAKAEMYYEGGFMGGIIQKNFPDLKPETDFNAFLFPQASDEFGAPVVGGGDLLAAFSDRPEVAELVKWMAGKEGNTLWAQTGAIVSPNKNVDLSVYSALGKIDAAQVAGATTFVFDGSDLTPSAVSSAMGTGLQTFLADPSTMDQVLQDIEKAAKDAYK
jgi:alpha-glucoside transport system substrate-binding protein